MRDFQVVDKATGDVLATVIHLWGEVWTECHLCGVQTISEWSIPVNTNGGVVPNNYTGEWGGVPACESCFRKHESWSQRIEGK